MIHIKKNEKTGHFHIVYTGNNNEVLSVSEPLKTKQSAWKNILSNWKTNHWDYPKTKDLRTVKIKVQDDSGLWKPKSMALFADGFKGPMEFEIVICNITL